MTEEENLLLVRYVKAACPQQAIDKYTPEAWYRLLGDLNFADADTAVGRLGRKQAFIAPCDIREEVTRIRDERIARMRLPGFPSGLDEAAYRAALHAARLAAADGRDPEQAMNAAVAAHRTRELNGGGQ